MESKILILPINDQQNNILIYYFLSKKWTLKNKRGNAVSTIYIYIYFLWFNREKTDCGWLSLIQRMTRQLNKKNRTNKLQHNWPSLCFGIHWANDQALDVLWGSRKSRLRSSTHNAGPKSIITGFDYNVAQSGVCIHRL